MTYHAVLSDLHWGEGKHLEDFARGREFVGFVDYVSAQGRKHGGCAELIINGDFIDFLRVAPFGPHPWRKATDKLERAYQAHEPEFRSLSRFIEAGHRLVILVGNHDFELFFPEVQARLV